MPLPARWVYAAVSHFKLDNYQDALAYINEYEHSKGIMGVGSKSFHATLLELNGDLEAAAKKFEEAANWDVTGNYEVLLTEPTPPGQVNP